MAVPPAPVRVPNQRPLAPSVTSVANYKSDIEIILGAVRRSPDICLTAEENPRKPQLGDDLFSFLYSSDWPYLKDNTHKLNVRCLFAIYLYSYRF